ncbi:MAG TPA: hypothetical protein VJZ00_01865 [Thermoanaerobaculia bacterium]|nr:hypothetical protein [Thermoanaerobaculia bacterium]
MSELHIDHLLLRYDSTIGDTERLQMLVERALDMVAAGVEASHRAQDANEPVTLDARASDDAVARRIAEALILKVERGG